MRRFQTGSSEQLHSTVFPIKVTPWITTKQPLVTTTITKTEPNPVKWRTFRKRPRPLWSTADCRPAAAPQGGCSSAADEPQEGGRGGGRVHWRAGPQPPGGRGLAGAEGGATLGCASPHIASRRLVSPHAVGFVHVCML